MNITQIEEKVQQVIANFKPESFIYDLLLAYDVPNATIAKLQQGNLNLSKVEGEIIWKKKLYFQVARTSVRDTQGLKSALPAIKNDTRFIVVTDYENLLAIDRKTGDELDIPITELPKHFDFFLPWAGMEKAQVKFENPADVKAAERMAKLFDEIKKDNSTTTAEEVHNLNVFLSRLLFCFFAEDTSIFTTNQFTRAIESHTQEDGSDLQNYLDKLFAVMNTPDAERTGLPAYLAAFPYVNGGLFRNQHHAPSFTRKSRDIIIKCGDEDWSAINPDIFGSMIQAVISTEHRGTMGMHYTSVPNIMKVIEPLFLDELKASFEDARGNVKKLNALCVRMSNIKIFDPACGSGNFLIIAYKELRKLEMEIFKEIDMVNKTFSVQFSGINLGNFFGIELDDFAHEVAILSLWLAEHQMNQVFFQAFGRSKPPLPLMETGNIVQGNACRIAWESVCPKNDGDEIYILGNPPYLGSSNQNTTQKEDMALVFAGFKNYKNLDYIAAWFLKGADYIKNINSIFSFVTTDSICQGEQTALLWPIIFNKNLEIDFAHISFKWKNNAKQNAGVSVVIIGIRNIENKRQKYIFANGLIKNAHNINAYLAIGQNIIVEKRSKSIGNLSNMDYGNKAVYGEPLILNKIERKALLDTFPNSQKFIKKLLGANEFIDGLERWCLWINDTDVEEAYSINGIKNRIDKVRQLRLGSVDKAANLLALKAHQFRDTKTTNKDSIIVPLTSSENRFYIPIGFITENEIANNALSVIYDAETWLFSILSSRLHILWIKAVCGTLESRIRYSSSIGYNTFPFPAISDAQKATLENHVYNIIEERGRYEPKTLAELYDPEKMPDSLRGAHRYNDLAVEQCYRQRPFESDEERLEYLFKLYEKMIAEEKEKGTLFAAEKKGKKK